MQGFHSLQPLKLVHENCIWYVTMETCSCKLQLLHCDGGSFNYAYMICHHGVRCQKIISIPSTQIYTMTLGDLFALGITVFDTPKLVHHFMLLLSKIVCNLDVVVRSEICRTAVNEVIQMDSRFVILQQFTQDVHNSVYIQTLQISNKPL